MTAHLEPVVLGEVLTRSMQRVTLEPDVLYREVKVRMNGKGVVERRTVKGIEIASDKRFLARAGQFIISRIDARNGASGLVPPELDGAVVTNDFPVFDIADKRLDAAYLGWMTKTASFVELCKRASEGTTNRVRLAEDRFSALTIHLPSLDEQRRVVGRIDAVATRITQTLSLKLQISEEMSALLSSASKARLENPAWARQRLEELCDVIADGTHQTPRYVDEGATFLSAQNVKPFRFIPEIHRKVSWEDFAGYTARNKPRKGDVLLTRVGAGIGEAAVVDQDIEFAIYVSVALIRPDVQRLLPEFMVQWLNSPNGTEQSRGQTLGRGHSQGNLNLNLLRNFRIPVPSIEEQRQIVTELDALRAKVDAARRLQSEAAVELEAMLPAVLDKAFRGEL
jgi:type I restriction enzyme, S subunit